jgi:hypothetical protein
MHQIKLTGVAEVMGPLDRNKNYLIAGEFEETSRTETDAKDGTLITTYKLKPVRLMKIEDSGEKVRLKTKNSNSTRIKGAIWHLSSRKPEMDSEEYYDIFTERLLKNLEGVLNYLEL